MNKKILIIGAGISGLSAAYHLSCIPEFEVTVIDKGYFMNGATGRNGAGIRTQWSTQLNILLSKYSVEFFEKGETHLDFKDSLEFKQQGYLILASDENEHEQFKKNVKLQNELGIPSQLLNIEESKKFVPLLNLDSFYSATYCKLDGHLNPFKVSEAFYLKCLKQGVVFKFFEEILDLKMTYQEIKAVVTNKETYYVDYVINCAGSYSKEIANMAGVDVPVYPEKHEILATEPVKPMLGPMVMSFSKNFYIQQVPHGPLIMGQGGKHLESSHDQTSTVEFLENISKTVLEVLPGIGNVRVQRQWAGSYDMSPDRSPIISKTEIKNLIVACGFSGRGFMIAPATGLLIRDLVLNQNSSIEGIDLKELSLERFKNKLKINELSFV